MRSGRALRPLLGLDACWWASLALAGACAALCVAGAVQTGIGWDEGEHRKYGEMSLAFYRTLGADRSATTYWTNYYGAFHALVGSAFERLFSGAYWPTARHLATVAFSLVGFLYTVRLARLLAGPLAGVVAALLLATTPRWVGDSMFNPCDIPTGAMYVTALYYLARLAGELESARTGDWLRFGVATGLTLAIRFVGILFLPYLVLAIAAWVLLVRPRATALRAHGPRIARGFLVAVLAAIPVTLLLWPRLMVEPVATLLDTFGRTRSYPWKGQVLFGGEFYLAKDVPRSYLATWFGLTTPLATLLGLVLALVPGACRRKPPRASPIPARLPPAAEYALARRWLPGVRGPWLRAGVVALATFFPPLYASAVHATVYDGIRHFLFVLPPLTVLAAAGWTSALGAARSWKPAAGVAVGAGLVVLALEPVVWYARLHPYEYVYFNPLAGGMARASHSYETDYWALSLREAGEWLSAHRREIVGSDGPLRMMTNTPRHVLDVWLDDPAQYERVEGDVPFHVFFRFYRDLPVGWQDVVPAPPAAEKSCVEGQVPFWQIHVVGGMPAR